MKALAKSPDLLAKVRKHWGEAQRLGRLAVEEAWLCGTALAKLKAALPHGEFLTTLADLDIPERTAQRMVRVAAEVKSDTLSDFDSVTAALKSIPAPRVNRPVTPANHVPQASVSEASDDAPGEGSADTAPDPSAALEAALDAERGKNEGLAEKLAIVEAQLDPKQLNQIDGLHAQIATLKSQVNSWQSKHNEMKRSRDWWRRKAKQLERQLSAT